MDKKFWGILGGLIIIAIVLAVIFGGTSSAPNSNGAKPTENIEGSPSTGVKLVEYGDFQCPFCAEYYQPVKDAVAKYAGQIEFQFRNLPLTSLHPNAFAAARAGQAAALQGKFWPMHDLLYENNDYVNQTGWVSSKDPLNDYFIGYAKQIGLNIDKFKTDFASTEVNDTINADINQFGVDYKSATGSYNALQDDATPTYFLDGKKIQPGPTAGAFESAIADAIKAKASNKSFTPSESTTSGGTNDQSTQAKSATTPSK